MPLFQLSVLKKYLNDLDSLQLHKAWKLFSAHFLDPKKQNNIRNLKEEEYQEGFVRDLFVKVLGYTLNPQPDYNFVLEKKTVADATKSDGAILLNGDVVAVIELKDTGTSDLNKVSTQAFGYKHKHKNCLYVITSNFEKLRFYINDATDYEEFNLFNLSKDRFAVLYVCLQQQRLLDNVPLQIKENSITQEENITKQLYADYSCFKKELFQDLVAKNPTHDKLLLFKKTQKLLDRFLFIFFAEDRLLLPPNSVREILHEWEQLKDLDSYVPLYNRYKKFFGYVDQGYKGKKYEIFAYNGGLFYPDEILDTLIIDDEVLYRGTKMLSNYDFETDVDVNILGHIFEHSLTEIEELQADLEGKNLEKKTTKRKKDGVFYTPRYITRYIVENTVGALCKQQREAMEINEETFKPEKRKSQRKILSVKLDAYREWLYKLTICDPACGSGAFLIAALEFLKEEHHYVNELKARLFGDRIIYDEIDDHILEFNLFGVDINEEAVEIARLSLWLHTAKKGRKLNDLTENIKCGNSLIDDPAVAGDKAFNWKKEFPVQFLAPAEYLFTIAKDYKERVTKYDENPEHDLEAIFEKINHRHLPFLAKACGHPINNVEDYVSAFVKLVNRENPTMMWMIMLSKEETAVQLLKEFSENNHIPLNAIHIIIMRKFLEDFEENFDEYVDECANFKLGFDVVIGNPPYVRQELLGANMKEFFSKKFNQVYNGTADLYVYFFEQGLNILKKDGVLGFITPNKWLERKYGNELRTFLKNLDIKTIINYGELRIFEDASTEPSIIIIKNEESNSPINYASIKTLDEAIGSHYQIHSYDKNLLGKDIWRFANQTTNSIVNKFCNSDKDLSDYTNSGIYRGILTGLNEAFIINSDKRNELVKKDQKSSSILKPMVEGDDLRKWVLNYSGRYMVATGYNTDIPKEYPAIFEYLDTFKSKLIKRQDRGVDYWNLRACDYYEKFSEPKIIYYHTAVNHNFYLDKEGYYISANCYIIANADTYLQCVLNSSLFAFVKKYLFPAFGDPEKGGRVRLDANKMTKLPIKYVCKETVEKFDLKADIMLSKNKELHQIAEQFTKLLQAKIATVNINNKLQHWYSLTGNEFLNELSKQKINLPLARQQEWLQYFEEQKSNACHVQQVIHQTDREIDAMVYELYQLTEEEIGIVEGFQRTPF